jgi:hypothetical protein
VSGEKEHGEYAALGEEGIGREVIRGCVGASRVGREEERIGSETSEKRGRRWGRGVK